jgi:RNA-binding protein
MVLSPRERKSLMARTHALVPRVRIGAKGLSDAVVAEVVRFLRKEPLTKVQLSGEREQRHVLAAELASRCGAALVGEVGKIAVLYRDPALAERASGAVANDAAAIDGAALEDTDPA